MLAEVAPSVQLGAALARDGSLANVAPRGVASDGPGRLHVVRVVTRSTRWDQLRGLATDAANGGTARPDRPVEAVYLETVDTARAATLVGRITRTFHEPPVEGCAGLDGVAVDRVLTWHAGDRGGVALTLPLYRAAGSEPVARLVAYAGPWRADRVEVGFEAGPCPRSRITARE